MNPKEMSQSIKAKAIELGFELVGIVPAIESPGINRYDDWLARGFAGRMDYLYKHRDRKANPRLIMPETKSIVALAFNYKTVDPDVELSADKSKGRISRYAWNFDYHDVVRGRLESLRTHVGELVPGHDKSRVYVDTGPVLERELAARAGLGWIGRNGNLINYRKGSWLFLSAVLLDLDLEYDTDPPMGDCGHCTACIQACPTEAIVDDAVVDARRCISYLTIELKGAIPRDLRDGLGNLVFGCDICQDVCPWNRKAPSKQEEALQPRPHNLLPDLMGMMDMDVEAFRTLYKGSPVKRTKRRGLLRNVAVALGNWGQPEAVPPLTKALTDEEPLVRGHAAWALGKIADPAAQAALERALETEDDAEALQEIKAAIAQMNV